MDNVSLRNYLEVLIQQNEIIFDGKLDALKKDIDKTAIVLNQQLESLNRIYRQIDEDRDLYVRKIEFDLTAQNMNRDSNSQDVQIRKLEDAYANFSGRLWMLGAAMTGFSALITIAVSLWVK